MTSNKDLDTITQTLTPFTTFDALKRAPEFILSLNIVNPMAVILANAYDEYHQKNTPKNGIPKKTHRWTATRFTQLSPRAPAVTEAIQSAAHYACHRLNATFGDATITAQFESLVREILATMLQGSDPRYTVATTVTRRVNELTA